MTGFEPATFRLEVWRAIQLRHTDYLSFTIGLMLEEGFEPSKRFASDLKSLPFDQTREP